MQSLDSDEVNVLDAFHGSGLVWQRVAEACEGFTIRVTGIDKKGGPEVIKGDNRKVMKSLDLSQFDLIDLDDYGTPADQLRIVSERTDAPVVVTAIHPRRGYVSQSMLSVLGIPVHWHRESPVPFARAAGDLWDRYCAVLGYTTSLESRHHERVTKIYQLLHKTQGDRNARDTNQMG